MIERLKGTFNMGMIGWLCLPALTLSLVLSVPMANIAASAVPPTGSVVETMRRDLSLWNFSEETRQSMAKKDPFEISEIHKKWIPDSMLRDRQVICLARNIWFESRGEPAEGQLAVGLVTLNRVETNGWPRTVCEVVYEPGQFTWTQQSGLRNARPSGEQWQQIVQLAATLMHRRDLFDDVTDGATYFHATYIKPGWARMQKTAVLGAHVFYKPRD